MEATSATLLRPAARRCLTSTRTALKTQIRTKATAARAKRALNIPPHPSFLSSDSHLNQDTIVFNPPSSASSVYHTPFKFLPKSDPRRRANLASLFEGHFAAPSASPLALASSDGLGPIVSPPPIHNRPPITKAEVEEMRELRRSDPHQWSVNRLAEKYDVPRGFIRACCQAPKEKIEFEKQRLEQTQKRWGPAKRKAREDRKRRNEMLYRGEI